MIKDKIDALLNTVEFIVHEGKGVGDKDDPSSLRGATLLQAEVAIEPEDMELMNRAGSEAISDKLKGQLRESLVEFLYGDVIKELVLIRDRLRTPEHARATQLALTEVLEEFEV